MRLKEIWISNYKNLNNFTLKLGGGSYLDIFVGKNGSGKSNLLEAIVEIFNYLYEFGDESLIAFDFKILIEIDEKDISIRNASGKLTVNDVDVKKIEIKNLPDRVILYYSGHNGTIASIVEKYELSFGKKIKSAELGDSRAIVSIGSEYKEILLTVLFLQSELSRAQKYILEKLGLSEVGPFIRIILKRPDYAIGKPSFDIDGGNEETKYWKAKGIVKEFLTQLEACSHTNSSGRVRDEGYIASEDHYSLYLDIKKIRTAFSNYDALNFFTQFDNLKTIGMLDEISVPIKIGNSDANISYFSDGQFQSVYIYAIAEIFKGKNCITLLDEPDAFLHPEWQFSFISQVNDIAEDTTKSNHLLMSSHSASTVSKADENTIRLFDFDGNEVKTLQVSKSEVIKSLSAGLISFSEGEARLSINHVLNNTNGPVLFVEGITDEIILETAWKKLYPNDARKFVIQNAFDRSFLRNLFSRDDLKRNFQTRKMFALFDFDDAYNDWSGLVEHAILNDDPFKGLAKQLKHTSHYALMLPVPNIESVKKQVLRENNTPWEAPNCHLSMEILFYSDDLLDKHFRKSPITGGGELIEFKGDKAIFAKDIVPTFSPEKFEVFRPIFQFIKNQSGLS